MVPELLNCGCFDCFDNVVAFCTAHEGDRVLLWCIVVVPCCGAMSPTLCEL